MAEVSVRFLDSVENNYGLEYVMATSFPVICNLFVTVLFRLFRLYIVSLRCYNVQAFVRLIIHFKFILIWLLLLVAVWLYFFFLHFVDYCCRAFLTLSGQPIAPAYAYSMYQVLALSTPDEGNGFSCRNKCSFWNARRGTKSKNKNSSTCNGLWWYSSRTGWLAC